MLNAFGVRLGGLAKKSSLRARCRCSHWQSSTLDPGDRGVRQMHTSLAEATLFRKHRNRISTWSCSCSSASSSLSYSSSASSSSPRLHRPSRLRHPRRCHRRAWIATSPATTDAERVDSQIEVRCLRNKVASSKSQHKRSYPLPPMSNVECIWGKAAWACEKK